MKSLVHIDLPVFISVLIVALTVTTSVSSKRVILAQSG